MTTDKLAGNFIAHIGSTEKHFNTCIREHLAQKADCPGEVIIDTERYMNMGLGMKAALRCNQCSYRSPRVMKFYEEIDCESTKKGPIPVKLNVQLQVALSKEPIGNSAMRNILATLDITPPSERGMQTMANFVSDSYKKINNEQLAKNRQLIETVMAIRNECEGETSPIPIAVEADGAYNNPPKGRSFSQPGTQSWVPMICCENGLEVPVGFATRSKLCSCPGGNVGTHRPSHDCGKTFASETPIGNSERDMGEDCATQIQNDGKIRVGTIIGDGDGHIAKGVKECALGPVDRQHCARHLTKSISRNLMKSKWESLPGPTVKLITKQKRDLAKFVEKRCAYEYKVAHHKYKKNMNRLVTVCSMIKRGILACIEGDTDTCRRVSLICKAHKRKGCGGNKRVGYTKLGYNTVSKPRIESKPMLIMLIYRAFYNRSLRV